MTTQHITAIKISSCILAALCIFTVGYLSPRHITTPDPMADKIWIEFSNAQHAIDSAGTLGGVYRGLKVCIGKAVTDTVYIPPSVILELDREKCNVDTAPRLRVVENSNQIRNLTLTIGDGRLVVEGPNAVVSNNMIYMGVKP